MNDVNVCATNKHYNLFWKLSNEAENTYVVFVFSLTDGNIAIVIVKRVLLKHSVVKTLLITAKV